MFDGGGGGPLTELRLFPFEGGTLTAGEDLFDLQGDRDRERTIPVPWYAISHPRGLVLIDGGMAAAVAVDPAAHWGRGTAARFRPSMRPEQACVPALGRAGLDPADVRWVVQTHLHSDHSGAVAAAAELPNAEFLVTREEWTFARAPHRIMRRGYIAADFADPRIRWSLLDPHEDGYDLFDDGAIRLWRSPGHSPGHLSIEVGLEDTPVLLTADAAYDAAQWEGRALPAVTTSLLEFANSLDRLHRIADRAGARVLFGHDPAQWRTLAKAPEWLGRAGPRDSNRV